MPAGPLTQPTLRRPFAPPEILHEASVTAAPGLGVCYGEHGRPV